MMPSADIRCDDELVEPLVGPSMPASISVGTVWLGRVDSLGRVDGCVVVDVLGIVDVVDVEGIVDVLGTVLVVIVVVVDVVGAVSVVVVGTVVVGGTSVVLVGTVVSAAAACGTDFECADSEDVAAMADVDANPKMSTPMATAIVAAKRFMNILPNTEKWSRAPIREVLHGRIGIPPPTRQEYREAGSDTQSSQY
jgi:hypothetical protein